MMQYIEKYCNHCKCERICGKGMGIGSVTGLIVAIVGVITFLLLSILWGSIITIVGVLILVLVRDGLYKCPVCGTTDLSNKPAEQKEE